MSRNSGVKAASLQKPNLDVWRPVKDASTGVSWAAPQTIEKNADADDVAICLSVTHDARVDVEKYLLSAGAPPVLLRSEERRVGKECRSRWSPYH